MMIKNKILISMFVMIFLIGIVSANTNNILANTSQPISLGANINTFSAQAYNSTWLEFDGSGDYINISNENLFENQAEVTWCVKYKPVSFTKTAGLISDRRTTGNYTQFTVRTNGRVDFICKNQTTETPSNVGEDILKYANSNVEYFVCGGYDSSGIYKYVNGFKTYVNNAEVNITVCNSSRINNFPLLIGSYFDLSSGFSANGTIDNVILYNRSLSEKEVLNIYKGYELNNYQITTNFSQWNFINVTSDTILTGSLSVNDFDNKMRELGNIIFDGSQYIITYSAYNGTNQDNKSRIGWANSSDGITWVKQNISLNSGGDGVSISNSSQDPFIIYNGTHYLMYVEDTGQNPFANISMYVSTNMQTWERYGVVLTNNQSGNWEERDVSSPTIIIDNGIWYMLYEGRGLSTNGQIGLATSTNGIAWTKNSINPIFNTSNSWDYGGVVPDDIIKIDNTFYILYHAYCVYCKNSSSIWSTGLITTTNLSNPNLYVRHQDNPFLQITGSGAFLNQTGKIMFLGDDTNTINITYTIKGDKNYLDINNNGLEVYLKFNENTGTIAYDSSGNGNNGTISGATWRNDAVLVTLTNVVDYTLDSATGVWTLINSAYDKSYLILTWGFETGSGCSFYYRTGAMLIMIFSSLAIIGFSIFYLMKDGWEGITIAKIIIMFIGIISALVLWQQIGQNLGSACGAIG